MLYLLLLSIIVKRELSDTMRHVHVTMSRVTCRLKLNVSILGIDTTLLSFIKKILTSYNSNINALVRKRTR